MTQDLVGFHDPSIVVLSIVIAVVGAYGPLALVERLTAARGVARRWWLTGTVTAMAIAIWSMHYTAMLAFNLPVPTRYDWPTAALAFLVGLAGSAAAFVVVTAGPTDGSRTVVGAVFMAAGIVGLHYLSMASMRLPAMHHYAPRMVVLSVLVALVFSLVSLESMRPSPPGRTRHRRLATTALLMGAGAISGMHYTAMTAIAFIPSAEKPDVSHAVRISFLGTLGITVVTLTVSATAVVTSLVDRLRQQRVLLDELFEQAPQAVALTDEDDRVVRVNREFTRMFGYTAAETYGRRLGELIVPADVQHEEQASLERLSRGEAVRAERVRRRKDGSAFPVSVIRVPVSVPEGQIAYAIYRDITDEKRAAEMLQTFPQRLIEVQEAERRRVARELHDELGQALTAIKLNLEAIQQGGGASPPGRGLDESIGIIERALQQVRDLSLDLRPAVLDDLGLAAALQWYVDREARRAGLTAEFVAEGLEGGVPADLATACFRIAQEALTNVVRHARARHVWVALSWRDATFHLRIRDDGIGFDATAARRDVRPDVHLGVRGMWERAIIVGGRIEIRSHPGGGTDVEAWFPLGRDESAP